MMITAPTAARGLRLENLMIVERTGFRTTAITSISGKLIAATKPMTKSSHDTVPKWLMM